MLYPETLSFHDVSQYALCPLRSAQQLLYRITYFYGKRDGDYMVLSEHIFLHVGSTTIAVLRRHREYVSEKIIM